MLKLIGILILGVPALIFLSTILVVLLNPELSDQRKRDRVAGGFAIMYLIFAGLVLIFY